MRARSLVEKVRFLKVAGHPDVPGELELTFVPDWAVHTYPGIYIAGTPARMLRPVRNLRLRDKATTEAIGQLIQKVGRQTSARRCALADGRACCAVSEGAHRVALRCAARC